MSQEPSSNQVGLDGMAIIVLGAVSLLGIVWAGAQLATWTSTGKWLPAGAQDAATALVHLPTHGGEPALAWPAPLQPSIPGPTLYWGCTALIAVVVLVVAVKVAGLITGNREPGMAKRKRLGVDTQAHLATKKDLKTLIVRKPGQSGRFVLGKVHGRLVATEDLQNAPTRGRRARRRQGDRMGVAIFGPTRCGKTANLIGGILDWPGPAILSSMKDDLLRDTLQHRLRLGEVKVFDPTRILDVPEGLRARWSPLRNAETATGAQRAAQAVTSIVPMGDVTSGDFWNASADQLLWPTFFAAKWATTLERPGGLDAVVRWILSYDTSEALAICEHLVATHESDGVRRDADAARRVLIGFRDGEAKTVASIYQTAQPMLRAIQDPLVADATASCDIDFEWLCDPNQANTLYVCSPPNDQKRLEMLFGGMFGDLLHQQAYERSYRAGPLTNPLLVLMDEAANTPCTWLPLVSSTCSGIGVLLVTVWQDISQIRTAYRDLAGSVLNNHGTKIFFTGQSDLDTQQYVTAQAGGEEVESRSLTSGRGPGGSSLQLSGREVMLVPGHVQRTMEPGNAVLIHGTLPAAHLVWRRWWRDRPLKRRRNGKGDLPSWMPRRTEKPEPPSSDPFAAIVAGPDSAPTAEQVVTAPTDDRPRPPAPPATEAPATAAALAARAGMTSVPPPPRR